MGAKLVRMAKVMILKNFSINSSLSLQKTQEITSPALYRRSLAETLTTIGYFVVLPQVSRAS
jgi:hypothetical protein